MWKKCVSGKKSLQIQKYPVTCGRAYDILTDKWLLSAGHLTNCALSRDEKKNIHTNFMTGLTTGSP